jgi:hypothetical protein
VGCVVLSTGCHHARNVVISTEQNSLSLWQSFERSWNVHKPCRFNSHWIIYMSAVSILVSIFTTASG